MRTQRTQLMCRLLRSTAWSSCGGCDPSPSAEPFFFWRISPFSPRREKQGKSAKHTGPGGARGKGLFLAGLCSQHSTCPEAVGLVYKFFPNGSLEDLLACKNNTHGRHALKLLERFVQLSFSFLAVLASHMISNPILLGL